MSEGSNWDDDKLGREKVAKHLTKVILDFYDKRPRDSSFVISLNSPWGFGKTFFLNRWKKDVSDLGHPVVYFDAWKTDFSSQPLLTFLTEFYDQVRSQLSDLNKSKDILDNAKNNMGKAAIPLLKGLLKHHTGVDLDRLDFDGLLKEYKEKTDSIKQFEVAVDQFCGMFSEEENHNLPIFVFVDELDRCRPSYSIEFLENIKHLFSSNKLCFVVATDLEQLSKSIKVVYGGEFDSRRYLHRFFDQEYTLPEPDGTDIGRYLFERTHIDMSQFFNPTKDELPVLFAKLARLHRLSVREQIKAFDLLEAMISTGESEVDVLFALALIMLRLANNDDFSQLFESGVRPGSLIKEIYKDGDYSTGDVVKTIRWRGNSGSHNDINMTDIITTYMTYLEKNYTQHMNDIFSDGPDELFREVNRRLRLKKPEKMEPSKICYVDLHYYPERVKQLGQIMVE